MGLGSICLISLFLIWGAVYKPKFFWKSIPVLALRGWLGNRKAENFTCSIGGSLFLLGWVYYSPIKVWASLVGVILIVAASGFIAYRFNSNFKTKRIKQHKKPISPPPFTPSQPERELLSICKSCQKNPPD